MPGRLPGTPLHAACRLCPPGARAFGPASERSSRAPRRGAGGRRHGGNLAPTAGPRTSCFCKYCDRQGGRRGAGLPPRRRPRAGRRGGAGCLGPPLRRWRQRPGGGRRRRLRPWRRALNAPHARGRFAPPRAGDAALSSSSSSSFFKKGPPDRNRSSRASHPADPRPGGACVTRVSHV